MARTQHRSVRITDPDWSEFLLACARRDKSRGTILRRLIRLYIADANVRLRVDHQPDPLGPTTPGPTAPKEK